MALACWELIVWVYRWVPSLNLGGALLLSKADKQAHQTVRTQKGCQGALNLSLYLKQL